MAVTGILLQPVEDFLELFDEVWLVEEKSQRKKQDLWQVYMRARGSQRLAKELKVLQLPPEAVGDGQSSLFLQQLVRHAREEQEEFYGDKGS